jgi:hypothetical protein
MVLDRVESETDRRCPIGRFTVVQESPMSVRLDQSPPRLSDMYGEARLDALYRRAAADRARFQAQSAKRPGLFARLAEMLRG